MNTLELQTVVKAIISKKPADQRELLYVIRRGAGRMGFPPPPKSKLLSAYHKLLKSGKIRKNEMVEKLLIKRAVRTMSGVAVVSVLTKSHPCPGKCVFCPTEKNMPKSYLSNEPAVMRAILNDFDPYRQIKMRLRALKANGHKTDKVELIVMGGTWSCHSLQYQSWYIKRCFEALNGRKASSLKKAQKTNEKAKHRCVGLTLETRPDYIDEKEVLRMRKLGCTRVELGIQHIDDRVLKLNKRGHNSQRSIEAIKLLKQAGFKMNFHLMVNLPGSTPARDLAMFKKLYTHHDWMPDMIKIYPCVVHEDALLYRWWKQGKYKPYTDKQLLILLTKIKKITPEYVRITRLIRDIPEESIIAGNKITNLRQIILDSAKKEGWSCQCIRCREVTRHKVDTTKAPKLKVRKYRASDGDEYFLSYETPDEKALYAFLRLRISDDRSSDFIPELKDSALVREVHTYGKMTALGEKGKVQHVGFGRRLLAEAEKIVRENRIKKIAVISGIGVREYYQKNGYKLEGTYMVKELDN